MSAWEKTLRPSTPNRALRARAAGFHVSGNSAPIPEYDALRDRNLDDFWASPATRAHFHNMGLMADDGSLISMVEYRQKLYVVEREMDRAEQLRERMAYRKQQMEIYQMARRKSEIMKARRAQEIRELKSERSHICSGGGPARLGMTELVNL
ncbi:hypothetical protein Pmar_PMAR027920 [Perkinsus marinus ATCC 50983]|uniref:Uncharacterized protein n=1 Tax=Perkinsus marinus (strain ATCC 50983 / TXsc) TaxID=423536 RepID=C5LDE8_PERM5|nr:hypothetical protein Pmar_PMAR027920 [Perkinsus marinus ATCC 50983]EER05280.1 hypothetical protein Pmar_PMAR027920 [Perkinsus marinus ATCC 50983]|eukprot:XP_002773464.1 hypothetical protein Pmar_PMAR027920 [Perkinsus marinus ATCC 50983]